MTRDGLVNITQMLIVIWWKPLTFHECVSAGFLLGVMFVNKSLLFASDHA